MNGAANHHNTFSHVGIFETATAYDPQIANHAEATTQ
jgi:hypothetical protein